MAIVPTTEPPRASIGIANSRPTMVERELVCERMTVSWIVRGGHGIVTNSTSLDQGAYTREISGFRSHEKRSLPGKIRVRKRWIDARVHEEPVEEPRGTRCQRVIERRRTPPVIASSTEMAVKLTTVTHRRGAKRG